MKAPEPALPAIVCAILARRKDETRALARIATACARDIGQPLAVQTGTIPRITRADRTSQESVLTLHLPAALATTQHEIWCLACRLACFCPTARVSVLVQGEASFASAPIAAPQRKPRTAPPRHAA